jgi:hypothetical protein
VWTAGALTQRTDSKTVGFPIVQLAGYRSRDYIRLDKFDGHRLSFVVSFWVIVVHECSLW